MRNSSKMRQKYSTGFGNILIPDVHDKFNSIIVERNKVTLQWAEE